MDEESAHNEEAAVFQARPPRPTLVRELIIWTVALLPALIGLFHLSVHSLVPFREKQAPISPATSAPARPGRCVQLHDSLLMTGRTNIYKL